MMVQPIPILHLLLAAAFTAALLPSLTNAASADALTYFDATSLTADEKEGYTNAVASLSDEYPMHTFLPTTNNDDGATIFWSMNDEEKLINFAIVVHATGWVGLGLSEAGGMIGSDIVLYESSNPTEVIDSYVVDKYAKPLEDECADWNYVNSSISEDGEWMTLEVSRLLNTNDSQDWPIMNDKELWSAPTRLIAAWGEGNVVSYHGSSKSRGSVRLYAEESHDSESSALEEVLVEQSAGLYFDVTESNHVIPPRKTQYHDVCKTFDELDITVGDGAEGEGGGITMIGAVPIISEETRAHVHHFTVYLQSDCNDFSFPRSMVYVWAPGDEGWALPENVGFPMFHNSASQAVYVQIHYNNPDLIQGMLDSSGVRFYYTTGEREEKAAILELGDPLINLNGETINDGLTKYEFTCPGACSRNGGGGSVTILNEFLHMHQIGVRMINEVTRNEEVVHSSSVDVYDFEQQGAYHVPMKPYQLLPGDGFRTTCYYRDGGEFGLGSDEEMCIAFLMYYPAQVVGAGFSWMCPYGDSFGPYSRIGCESDVEISDIASSDDLGRSFGTADECAVDSLLPPPTKSPVTLSPTISARPSTNVEPCILCPDGVTVDAEFPGTGMSCEEIIAEVALIMFQDSDACVEAQGAEFTCCPTLAAKPCPFCASGLTIADPSAEIPGADGLSCDDLVGFAFLNEEDSGNCGEIQTGEAFCCNINPCSFCPDGITLDEDFVIPGAPNGETCGNLVEVAATLGAASEFCPQIQTGEIACCPPSGWITPPVEVMDPCSFCPDGITLDEDFVIPGAPNEETCGDLVDAAAMLETDSEFCPQIQAGEIACCPSSGEIEVVDPCSFCPDGIAFDEDYVFPGAPNGETCGYLVAVGPTLEISSELCPSIQAAEIVCCPPVKTSPPTESPNMPTNTPTSKSTLSPTASPQVVATAPEPSAGLLHGIQSGLTLALLAVYYLFV